MQDTIQSIRRSSRHFFSGTLLSRITGMLRDISMAYAFGTHPSIAAFMVSFRFAHLLRRLFGEGALQSSFIPEFESLRQQSSQRAFSFFRDLTLSLAFFLILVVGFCCAILSGFLFWGNLHPDNREIVQLTLFMFPSLLFICLFGLNASLLQCEKKYFISSAAPVAFNGIWIACVLSLKNLPPEKAMPWLSLGIILACFFQWIFTVPSTWKYLKPISISSCWNSLRQLSPDLRLIIKPLFLGILGVAASQINNAIDSLFAYFADPEGPAFLWYAIRIQQLPLALFGIAIAGSILPPLSRALKAQQWKEYDQFLMDGLHRTWNFILPLTAALFLMGDIGVNFLYGRGDFDSQSVIQTTRCLWAYGLGLIPSALVLILAPAYYAQSNYTLPAIASLATLVLNLFLNTLFIFGFKWGAMSVALSTSFSAWVNLTILGWSLFRSRQPIFLTPLLRQCLPISLSTGLATGVAYQCRMIFFSSIFSPTLFNSSLLTQFWMLTSETLLFAGFLFIFHFLVSSLLKSLFYDPIYKRW